MDVLVTAKDGFIHGSYRLERGQEAVMPQALADELAHLVEVKAKPQGKAAAEPAGNAPAAGEAQQSSASPAAPASPPATAKKSAAGKKAAKKTAK